MVGQPESIEQRVGLPLRLARPLQPCEMDQVLARGQAVVEAGRLREQPDPRAQLRPPGAACRDLVAGYPRPAGVRRQQPGEHAQGGGFSGAVRSEKAEDLAPLHGEGDLAARRTAAERFAEPLRLDRRQAAAILPLRLARRLAWIGSLRRILRAGLGGSGRLARGVGHDRGIQGVPQGRQRAVRVRPGLHAAARLSGPDAALVLDDLDLVGVRHGANLRTPLEGRECGTRQTWWWSVPATTASSPRWCSPAAGSMSWFWRRRRSSAAQRAPNGPSRGSRGLPPPRAPTCSA